MCYAISMANIGNARLNAAQRKLVEDNVRLVYKQAHDRGIFDEDLIQEGMLGLVNAARYYSPDFGVKFSTYAGSYIWAALMGSYSDKKYRKNKSNTCSLDDEELHLQLPSYDADRCFSDLFSDADPLANKVIKYICEGFTKKEICLLLNLVRVDKNGENVPNILKLNAILKKIGRDLYGERSVKKEDR